MHDIDENKDANHDEGVFHVRLWLVWKKELKTQFMNDSNIDKNLRAIQQLTHILAK